MKKKSILKELKVEFPYLDMITATQEINGSCVFKNKIMHFRADYDGYRWHNTVWPYYDRKCPIEHAKEIDEVYDRLIADNAFKDLSELKKFCFSHPEAEAKGSALQEFNFYYEGKYCLYWLRAITRNGDYNLYLNAYKKE